MTQMATLVWEIQAEFYPSNTQGAVEQALDSLGDNLCSLRLPAATQERIRWALAAAIQRRPDGEHLTLRLLTNGLAAPGTTRSYGFFLVERQNDADMNAGSTMTIELYLFA